jgi:hypothetical protein
MTLEEEAQLHWYVTLYYGRVKHPCTHASAARRGLCLTKPTKRYGRAPDTYARPVSKANLLNPRQVPVPEHGGAAPGAAHLEWSSRGLSSLFHIARIALTSVHQRSHALSHKLSI